MSYCRFIEADAYIYDDVYHGIICCACSLMPLQEADMSIFGEFERYFINKNFIAGYDFNKMLAHVAEHRAAGDHIPEDVDERLIFDRDCTHEFNSERYCKHCWRKDEKGSDNI